MHWRKCFYLALALWGARALYSALRARWRLQALPPAGRGRGGRRAEALCVLISGCDTGFGYLTAKRLDALKLRVLAGCYTEEGIKRIEKECSKYVFPFLLDVTSPKSVEQAAQLVQTHCSSTGLHALINNAGISSGFTLEFSPMREYRQVMEVNFFGAVALTQALMPFLRRARGRVINLSSIAGFLAAFGMGGYAASKHALEAFSDALRREVKPTWDMNVVVVEPGFHNTGLPERVWRTKFQRAWEGASGEIRSAYGKAWIDSLEQQSIKALSGALHPANNVVDVLEDACLSVYPLTRYRVGTEAHFLHWASHTLPTWLLDWLLSLRPQVPVPAVRCCPTD